MQKEDIEICKENVVDIIKVNKVRATLPDNHEILDLSDTFKTLGDPTRLKIVLALAKEEFCVCDLSSLINLSISAISHQLRLLRNMKLVKFRKEGKMVYYTLDDSHIENIIREGQTHVNE
jgi:DNA-binding transcriptional ArsR family regulator